MKRILPKKKQLIARFNDNDELEVYFCEVCQRISFKQMCWTCKNNNRLSKGKIITLIKK